MKECDDQTYSQQQYTILQKIAEERRSRGERVNNKAIDYQRSQGLVCMRICRRMLQNDKHFSHMIDHNN